MANGAETILGAIQPAIQSAAPVSNLIQGFQTPALLRRQALQNELTAAQVQAAPLQRELLGQQIEAGKLGIAQAQNRAQQVGDQERFKSLVFAAQDAKLLPPESRMDFFQKRVESLRKANRDPSDTMEAIALMGSQTPEQFEGVLDQVIGAGVSRGVLGTGTSASTQFGGQQTFKDEAGNLFFGTTKRDPNTGQVESVLAPIDGVSTPSGKIEMAGSYGLTAAEKVGQVASEKTAADRASANEDARQSFIKQGIAARGMIPKTKRLLELNRDINSGRLTKALKSMADIFGVTDPDVGQFNALAGSLVLENIRALGANPTEGERAFLQEITPSLQQGGAVNEALLNDMLEIQNRQVERAKWFSKNKGKTVEEYLLETGTDEFSPSSQVDNVQTDAQPAQQSSIQEGATATNPATGERVVFRNGQWQPI